MSIDTPHSEGELVRHVGAEGASVPHVLTTNKMDHRMVRNFIHDYQNDKPSRFIRHLKQVRSVFFSNISPVHKGLWGRF